MDAGALHQGIVANSLPAVKSMQVPPLSPGASDLCQVPYCYRRLSPEPAVKPDNGWLHPNLRALIAPCGDRSTSEAGAAP
jgi:hypothetical protein